MERHGEPVGFVANLLHQSEGRTLGRERNPFHAIASKQQLLLLRQPDGYEPVQSKLSQCGVGRRQLSLATVDENQVREWTALFEQLLVATLHDLLHRRKVIRLCSHSADRKLAIFASAH